MQLRATPLTQVAQANVLKRELTNLAQRLRASAPQNPAVQRKAAALITTVAKQDAVAAQVQTLQAVANGIARGGRPLRQLKQDQAKAYTLMRDILRKLQQKKLPPDVLSLRTLIDAAVRGATPSSSMPYQANTVLDVTVGRSLSAAKGIMRGVTQGKSRNAATRAKLLGDAAAFIAKANAASNRLVNAQLKTQAKKRVQEARADLLLVKVRTLFRSLPPTPPLAQLMEAKRVIDQAVKNLRAQQAPVPLLQEAMMFQTAVRAKTRSMRGAKPLPQQLLPPQLPPLQLGRPPAGASLGQKRTRSNNNNMTPSSPPRMPRQNHAAKRYKRRRT